MAAAPWDKAQRHEQLFVLVTGSNSGVGLGACERLIDLYLATSSLSSHLILIPTTRSVRKSSETIEHLRKHLHKTANTSEALLSRGGSGYDPQDTIDRVHFLSVQLDLCDPDTLYAAADQLVNGTVGDPTDKTNAQYKLPRLDGVILNAGLGGWTGLSWLGLIWKFLTQGLIQMCSYPDFRIATPGLTVEYKPKSGKSSESSSPYVLGQVFCGNVFGHYILCHELMPLLSRASESERPGRIVWTSSLASLEEELSLDDFQGLKTKDPYDSSKRLTDMLALTRTLPAAKPEADSYFTIDDPKVAAAKPFPPAMYVTHPGIVFSTLFPLFWGLMKLYEFAMYLSRWIGSPWHTASGYVGATACVWAVLEDGMEDEEAHKSKWGACTDVWGTTYVKKTEVDGWAWDGVPVDDEALAKEDAIRVLRRATGRRPPTKTLTPEARRKFEADGAKVWAEMERLRRECGVIAGRQRKAVANGRTSRR